jgi:hypothetical protein
MPLAAPQLELRTIKHFSISSPHDLHDVVVPHSFGRGIEGPLHETSEPEKLSAINCESALYLMSGLPMITLASFAAVVGRRRTYTVLVVVATDTTSAASLRKTATICTRLARIQGKVLFRHRIGC